MATGTATQWLGVCLFYGEPWDQLLVKAIKPFTDVALNAGIAQRFYFERRWDRGPHIRLWFKGNPDVLIHVLKPNLEEHFQQFFQAHPSQVTEPDYPEEYPEDQKWLPTNSVRYLYFDPSEERTGGTTAQQLFEDSFTASSVLVLQEMKIHRYGYTFYELLALAVKCHIAFAAACGMTHTEAAAFFRYIYERWTERARIQPIKTSNYFKGMLDLFREDSISHIVALWEIFSQIDRAGEAHWKHWLEANTNFCSNLRLTMEKEGLSQHRDPRAEDAYWPWYEELVHLTNNRVGILDKHEGFLYYLLAENLAGAVRLKNYLKEERA